MHAAVDRLEFAPPPPPGLLRAFSLAVLAHLLLLGALTWGVHWKRQDDNPTVEAELWSALPQQAAPRPVEVRPPEPAKPAAAVKPAPAVRDPDIALQREKRRLEKEKLEKEKLEQAQRERDKREQLKKAEAEKKKLELEAARKEALKAQEEEKKLAAQRQENLKRIAGLAGATGDATATGTAQQSSGPSGSYAGRLEARIRPNVVFPDVDLIQGNPAAEVEIRTAPDGTIVGQPRLVKSSGNKSWDEAALRAIEKTEVMPRDLNGKVPSPFPLIVLRPKQR